MSSTFSPPRPHAHGRRVRLPPDTRPRENSAEEVQGGSTNGTAVVAVPHSPVSTMGGGRGGGEVQATWTPVTVTHSESLRAVVLV